MNSGSIQPEIANKLQEWFESGLQNWDISRDAPYWGFQIPDTTEIQSYITLSAKTLPISIHYFGQPCSKALVCVNPMAYFVTVF